MVADPEKFPILSQISGPPDMKALKPEDLLGLSSELRQYIIDVVSSNPGHFGASLGVVELTVALHHVYNTPFDRLIWDVGHQAYGHKILTGRRDIFHTNRKYKGVSGFPKMSESDYDTFGVGHSSTSISAGLGMAFADKQLGEKDRRVVVVIGDGSLTGGQAFEGLNNAGHTSRDILVILNDNNISIDPSVGAMKEYLLDITTSKAYNKVKTDVWNLLGFLNKITPNARQYVQKIENAMKSIVLKQSNLFESLNFRYFGPVDGHDVIHLSSVLRDLRDIPGPKLLHVITKKGKGFPMAEKYQTAFHSPGSQFSKETGEFLVKRDSQQPPRYQDVFGESLLELARQNKRIVGITPAMTSGSALNKMMDEMPDRAFDVGIAEQHAMTFAAGLAAAGMTPYCTIYSTFLQRAYDQLIHDVALQNLPVVICVDRAGLVGPDGATHHGVYDLAFLRCIPNLTIASPYDVIEFRNLLYSAQADMKGPYVIRYPRARGNHLDWRRPFQAIKTGTGVLRRQGTDLAIVSIGPIGQDAAEAVSQLEKQGIDTAHYDLRFLKPLDESLLTHLFDNHKKIITLEDGAISGGMGSALLEFMADHGYHAEILRIGIPDRFIDHGTIPELYRECGMDTTGIIGAARKLLGAKIVMKAI